MIILTGGAGFIGSAFLRSLNDQGADNIIVVDNIGESEKWRNLQGKNFVDYLNKSELLGLLESGRIANIKTIVHMGACSSTTERNAEYMLENNYRYTKSLAQFALEKGIRFIYASSAATYGGGEFGYDDDSTAMGKLRPLNVYGYSKLLFDLWAKRTGALDSIVGLKFFNVYGPNEYHKGEMRSVVLKSFEQIQSTGEVKLFASHNPNYKDGEQKRDFIYVKDCCDIMAWLMEHPKVNGVFNCGSGEARSWKALAEGVFAALDRPSNIKYIDMPEHLRGQYQYFTEATMNRLRQAGYNKPPTSLEQGVRDYVAQYLNHGRSYL